MLKIWVMYLIHMKNVMSADTLKPLDRGGDSMNRDTEIVRNTLMWIWNVDWHTFADVVFDVDIDTAPDHRLEYLAKYNEARITNPANLFAMLDYEKMDKITTAASEKYGVIK